MTALLAFVVVENQILNSIIEQYIELGFLRKNLKYDAKNDDSSQSINCES